MLSHLHLVCGGRRKTQRALQLPSERTVKCILHQAAERASESAYDVWELGVSACVLGVGQRQWSRCAEGWRATNGRAIGDQVRRSLLVR